MTRWHHSSFGWVERDDNSAEGYWTFVLHEHEWQDTGFADLDDCAVEGCRATRHHVDTDENDFYVEDDPRDVRRWQNPILRWWDWRGPGWWWKRLRGRAGYTVSSPKGADDLTWAEKEAICDEVLAVRKERFKRSYDIECPECGKPPGVCCMNLGSAGGPVNHRARIDATPASPQGAS